MEINVDAATPVPAIGVRVFAAPSRGTPCSPEPRYSEWQARKDLMETLQKLRTDTEDCDLIRLAAADIERLIAAKRIASEV